jgi:ribosomal protein S18 acetylase RimI-like enzyme
VLPGSSDRADSARSRCQGTVRNRAAVSHDRGGAAPYEVRPVDLSVDWRSALVVMVEAAGRDDVASTASAGVVRRHAGRAGLIARGAFDVRGRLIGICYGFPADPDGWWEAQVLSRLVAAGTAHWFADAFTLTELHVDPAHQGRGLGRRLITDVLTATDLPRAVLTVLDGPGRARRLYGDLGFTDLAAPFRFAPDQPAYAVMGARLPLASDRRSRAQRCQ